MGDGSQVRSFNAAAVISSRHFHPVSDVVSLVILWFEVRLIWVHQLPRRYNIHKYTSLRLQDKRNKASKSRKEPLHPFLSEHHSQFRGKVRVMIGIIITIQVGELLKSFTKRRKPIRMLCNLTNTIETHLLRAIREPVPILCYVRPQQAAFPDLRCGNRASPACCVTRGQAHRR